jgi:hypothetical protein
VAGSSPGLDVSFDLYGYLKPAVASGSPAPTAAAGAIDAH